MSHRWHVGQSFLHAHLERFTSESLLEQRKVLHPHEHFVTATTRLPHSVEFAELIAGREPASAFAEPLELRV